MNSCERPAEGRTRPAGPEDAAALAAIYRPYVEKTAVTFEYEAPDADEMLARLRAVTERYPWLVWECGGRVEGYAYASPFQTRAAYDRSAQVSVYVREDCRGQGIGRALYAELEEILKRQRVTNVYACIASPRPDNTRLDDGSIRFHAALGFRLAGTFCRCGNKFSQWYDMCWMEKFLDGHGDPDEPFVPFSRLAETTGEERKETT